MAKKNRAASVKCWGSGTPLREFLYAEDLGKASVFALENWSTLRDDAPRDDCNKPLAFLNVGTGNDIKISELAEKVAATVGYGGCIEWDQSKPDGTPKKQLDVSRLTSMGWRASIGLTEGLQKAYGDYKIRLEEGTLRT